MTKDEALRMAIGDLVLQKMVSGNDVPVSRCTITATEIQVCKDALAETQEPVAYQPTSQEQSVMHQAMIRSSKLVHKATQPSREWVGLSDDEYTEIRLSQERDDIRTSEMLRKVEAKLREKNEK